LADICQEEFALVFCVDVSKPLLCLIRQTSLDAFLGNENNHPQTVVHLSYVLAVCNFLAPQRFPALQGCQILVWFSGRLFA